MTRVGSLILLILASLTTTCSAQSAQDFVVKVRIEGCQGGDEPRGVTAFKLVGHEGLLTSLHGIAGCSRFSVTSAPGFAGLEPVAMDFAHDLVLLSSPEIEMTFDLSAGLQVGDPVSLRQPLDVLGFPPDAARPFPVPVVINAQRVMSTWQETDFEAAIRLRMGSPSVEERLLSLVGGRLIPGHSGSPVIDLAGHVVGVLQGGFLNVEIGFAVPIDDFLPVPFDAQKVAIIPDGIDHRLFAVAGPGSSLAWLGIDLTAENLVGFSSTGDYSEVSAILASGEISPDARSPGGNTALFAAAENGHADIVRMLLAAGANPEPTNGGDVILAAVSSKDPAIVAAVLGLDPLLGAGDFPDIHRVRARTALRRAIEQNNAIVVAEVLQELPALATSALPDGLSPIEFAVRKRAAAAIEALMGLEVVFSEQAATETLSVALGNDDLPSVLALRRAWPEDMSGCSVLGRAISMDSGTVVAALIDVINVNRPACGDNTPLFVALETHADKSLGPILEASPFIRNPVNGKIPEDPTLEMIRTDSENRMRLIARLRQGIPAEEAAFELSGLLFPRSRTGGDLLSAAAYSLDPRLVDLVLENGGPGRRCERGAGATPMYAVFESVADKGASAEALESAKLTIDALLAFDADFSWSGCEDSFPLQAAVPYPELVEHLLTKSMSATALDVPTMALGSAAIGGYAETARLLLDAGADPCGELVNHFGIEGAFIGETRAPLLPLSASLVGGHDDLFAQLLKAGKNTEGNVCPSIGQLLAVINVAACIGREDAVRQLLPGDSRFQPHDPRLKDAYVCAAKSNDLSTIDALNDAGQSLSAEWIDPLADNNRINPNTIAHLCNPFTGSDRPQSCPDSGP